MALSSATNICLLCIVLFVNIIGICSQRTVESCHPVTIEECRRNAGYMYTTKHQQTQDTLKPTIQFSSQITSQCDSDAMWPFLCSLMLPVCMNNKPVHQLPCRSLCQKFQDECDRVFAGLALFLPNVNLTCSLLKEDDCWVPSPLQKGDTGGEDLPAGKTTTTESAPGVSKETDVKPPILVEPDEKASSKKPSSEGVGGEASSTLASGVTGDANAHSGDGNAAGRLRIQSTWTFVLAMLLLLRHTLLRENVVYI